LRVPRTFSRLIILLSCTAARRVLSSFPTRRSSDLVWWAHLGSSLATARWRTVHHIMQLIINTKDYLFALISVLFHRSDAHCVARSEEHTSELQSRFDLVCRLLLEKKKRRNNASNNI